VDGNGPYRHTHTVQQQRRRTELFALPNRPCGLCGHGEAIVTEVRTVRRVVDWLNPAWSPDVELFEVCSACRARRPLDSGMGQHALAAAPSNPLQDLVAGAR
jgi:hypothetical protein